jgi:hypothetical protein
MRVIRPRRTAVVLIALTIVGGACGGSTGTTLPPPADPGGLSAGKPSTGVYTPGAALVADTAFRPDQHGLPFENYGKVLSDGSAPTNLTADDVRAMFGDRVCADAKTGRCDLIPGAKAWLDSTNREMAGGHCYGFSIAAELLWQRKLDASAFGAKATPALDIEKNQALQRSIAYYWATQLLDSVRSKGVFGTPNEVLKALRQNLMPNPTETYTLIFFKRDGTGGHAVTPFGVEDTGNGKFNVLIYDNNWPSVVRAMTFDTKADGWRYDAAVNPKVKSEVYEGDEKTQSVGLLPTSPGLGPQPCPFCGKRGSSSKGRTSGSATTPTEEIFLDGRDTDHAHLLITDDSGHRLGTVDGNVVNEIPGAQVQEIVENQDWGEAMEPHFLVPQGGRYKVVVDATKLRRTDRATVGVIGTDFDVSVRDLAVRPGDKDTLIVEGDGTAASFRPSRAKAWTDAMGANDDQADYDVEVKGSSDQHHPEVDLTLPVDAGVLTVARTHGTGASTADVAVTRETDEGLSSSSRTVTTNGAAPATVSLTG